MILLRGLMLNHRHGFHKMFKYFLKGGNGHGVRLGEMGVRPGIAKFNSRSQGRI